MKWFKWLSIFVCICIAKTQAAYIPATTLFDWPNYTHLELSPNHRHVAFFYSQNKQIRLGFWDAPDAHKKLSQFKGEYEKIQNAPFTEIEWLGDDVVMASTFMGRKYVVDFRKSVYQPETYWLKQDANQYAVLHPLPNVPDEFIASYSRDDGFFEAYRVRINSKDKTLQRLQRLGKGLDRVVLFGIDAKGNLRAAAQVSKDEKHLIFYMRSGNTEQQSWRKIFSLPISKKYAENPDELADQYHIVSVGNDGYIYLVSNLGEEYKVLKRIREGMAAPEVVHRIPGQDIVGANVDQNTFIPISVITIEDGQFKEHLLSKTRFPKELHALLKSHIITNHAGDRFILLGIKGQNRLKYYYYNSTQKELHYIHPISEELQKYTLSHSETFTVKSVDGLEIEAYLNMPAQHASGKLPLVVMPHGGPMGVRDLNIYDPMVEYLASRGIAILRVNFRGSRGYGRSFLLAGRGEIGQRIEADIEVARRYAVKHFPIDRKRQCIMGASYGGYSALRSAMLHPSTYRCVVASFPVTDIPLLFNDIMRPNDEEQIKKVEEVLGPLSELRTKWFKLSPTYQANKISVPVLMTGGYLDTTATVEHIRRMAYMLNQHKKPFSAIIFPESTHRHVYWRDAQLEAILIFGFLAKHLNLAAQNIKDFQLQSGEFIKASERLDQWDEHLLLGSALKAYFNLSLKTAHQ